MVPLSIMGMTGWVNPYCLAVRRPGTLSVARRRTVSVLALLGLTLWLRPGVLLAQNTLRVHMLVRCLAAWSLPRRLQCSAQRWGVPLGLPLVLLTSSAMAAQVTLAWDVSVSMVDGYWLYYGSASGIYTTRIDVGPVTTYTVTGLTSGQAYYFAVTAYDRTDGRESGPSNEVSTTLPLSGGPTLSVTPTSVAAEGMVTATWAGIPSPSTTDWLGLYTPGGSDTAYLAWRYTPGTASGNAPFTIPSTLTPGTYELRLLSNNGFTRLATSNSFAVQ